MDHVTPVSSSVLLIVLLGAAVGAGVLLLVLALMPTPVRVEAGPPPALVQSLKRAASRLSLGVGVGLLVLVLTRWPVLAIAAGALAFFGPVLFGGARSEKQAIARLEGLAAWTESLRDTIAGAVGLEQAIPATAYAASPAISRELVTLADRLRVRVALPQALHRFADDLDDASADLIVSALILNARLRGPGLRDVLTSLASSARAELEMRRRVNAGRASTRRSVQIVVGITVLFVLGLAVFNRAYVEPYSSPVGQLVLLVIIGLFAAGFFWMRRLSVFEVPGRFLFTQSRGSQSRSSQPGRQAARTPGAPR
ncbi:MAG TPA: type II secretion system F family protein [Nocardioidaceae bacterium]|nr:type II secretion system F family protein [Nocardioidaceae bacterium]